MQRRSTTGGTAAPGPEHSSGEGRISCVLCAYNEADRIDAVLDAVCGHPAVTEVLVVNDGSTDGTEARLRARSGIRLLSHQPNRGKSYALSRGLAAVTGDHVLLLDADLAGLDREQVGALIEPVLSGAAEVSISLRRNSLGLYRWIGLDFVSGERLLPADLVREYAEAVGGLPPWGAEAYMNELIIQRGFSVAVVDWASVSNIRKGEKVGRLRGWAEELRMVRDALTVLTPWGVLRQNLALLRLKRRAVQPAPSFGRSVSQAIATRSAMLTRVVLLTSLTLSGCATAPRSGREPSELDALSARCRERGGILSPIPGAVTGRAATDFTCEIRGPAPRR